MCLSQPKELEKKNSRRATKKAVSPKTKSRSGKSKSSAISSPVKFSSTKSPSTEISPTESSPTKTSSTTSSPVRPSQTKSSRNEASPKFAASPKRSRHQTTKESKAVITIDSASPVESPSPVADDVISSTEATAMHKAMLRRPSILKSRARKPLDIRRRMSSVDFGPDQWKTFVNTTSDQVPIYPETRVPHVEIPRMHANKV